MGCPVSGCFSAGKVSRVIIDIRKYGLDFVSFIGYIIIVVGADWRISPCTIRGKVHKRHSGNREAAHISLVQEPDFPFFMRISNSLIKLFLFVISVRL